MLLHLLDKMGTYTVCLLLLLAIVNKSCTQPHRVTVTAGTKNDCRQEFGIAVTEEDSGVGISLFYENADISGNTAPPQNHVQLSVDGHQLSAECGDKLFRCQDLLVVSTTLNKTFTQHLLLVPLSDGLLIVKLLHDGLSLSFNEQHVLDTSLPASYHCSPVASYAILHGYYIVCVDSERHYVSLLYINLNKTSIKQSTLSYPIIEYQFEESEDMKTLSNFVYVTSTEMIYFALGNRMYAMKPLFDILNDDFGRIGNNCTHVTKLEYLGNRIMRAYCKHAYVNYNLDVEDWDFQWWNDIDGVAYSCPNSNLQLNVFRHSMYIRYNINSLVGNINIPGANFDNGICFGAANKIPLFAYSDLNEGLYIVDLNTTDIEQVSTTPCDTSGCLPLLVFQDRYLVVREKFQNDGMLYVIDAEENRSKIIVAQHTIPKLIALINDTDKRCQQNTTEIDVIPLDETANVGAVVGSIFGVIVFIVLLAVVATGIVVYTVCHHQKRKGIRHSVQEDDKSDQENGHAVNFSFQKNGVDISGLSRNRYQQLPPNTLPIQANTTTTAVKNSLVTTETEEGKSQNTKRVGNSDDINSNRQETVEMEILLSPGRAVAKTSIQGSAITTMSPSKENIDDVEALTPVVASEGSSSVLSEAPKLATFESPQENWKTEDDSESSLSSTDDDKAPLINNEN